MPSDIPFLRLSFISSLSKAQLKTHSKVFRSADMTSRFIACFLWAKCAPITPEAKVASARLSVGQRNRGKGGAMFTPCDDITTFPRLLLARERGGPKCFLPPRAQNCLAKVVSLPPTQPANKYCYPETRKRGEREKELVSVGSKRLLLPSLEPSSDREQSL